MTGKTCPVCGKDYPLEVAFCQIDGARLLESEEARKILDDDDPLVRTLVGGRYRLLRRIGEGGMGMVYLAEHEAIEKRVAIKVLKEQYALREDVVARFQQEARSASRIKHEGILEVFDFGRTDDGRFFLAMELLEGVDLARVLEAEMHLEPVRAVRLAIKMARALGAAHLKGVIHRDMKPENVFVRTDEEGREHIKIVDFGIAQLRADGEDAADPNAKVSGRKLTKTGVIFGTPEYMSPEQAQGKSIDRRVDVYALGVMLFEMLTGKTPFHGETFMGILSAHMIEPIPALVDRAPLGFECSPELAAVVHKSLAKKPEERFASMPEFAQALIATPEGMSDESLRALRGSHMPSLAGVVPSPTNMKLISHLPPAMHGGPTTVSVAPAAGPIPDARAATMVEAVARPQAATEMAVVAAPEKKTGGGGAIKGIAAVAVVLIGVTGYFVFRAMTAPVALPVPANSSASAVKEPVVASSPPSVSTSAAPPASSSAPAPSPVVLKVETTPPGAIVEREVGKDWLQVCDTTPCEVKVPAGTAVHLRATKNGATADKRLLADADQKATFTLGGGGVAKPPGSAKPQQDLCEVVIDEGIKVWKPCPKK
ncbi:MAG: serine/threonine protein kinase [Myxococcales bacterium]|nr:serine/threonine protein kinase [Myxococcales bacterium]